MLIKSLRIKNLLSFGPNTEPLPLTQLNVLIGPNGSGKSNFLEAISLLQAAPSDLSAPVKEISGIHDWLWQGALKPIATLEALVENPKGKMPLRHAISFTEHGSRFELIEERIENELPFSGEKGPYFFYRFQNGYPVLKESSTAQSKRAKHIGADGVDGDQERELKRETLNPEQSILSQVK